MVGDDGRLFCFCSCYAIQLLTLIRLLVTGLLHDSVTFRSGSGFSGSDEASDFMSLDNSTTGSSLIAILSIEWPEAMCLMTGTLTMRAGVLVKDIPNNLHPLVSVGGIGGDEREALAFPTI